MDSQNPYSHTAGALGAELCRYRVLQPGQESIGTCFPQHTCQATDCLSSHGMLFSSNSRGLVR